MVGYLSHLGIFLAVYMLLAFGLNMVLGYCGRLSLAHVTFFALGGYGYAFATIHLDLGMISAICLSLLVVIPFVGVFVVMTHARHGDQYVLMSLACQAIVYSLASNWYDGTRQFGTITSLTNGPFGVSGIPRPEWLSEGGAVLTLVVMLVAGTGIVVVALPLKTGWGRCLRAMRDDEAALASLGKDVFALHFEAVCVGSMLAALGGCIYALYVGYVDPSLCNLDQAVLVLSMLIVGGMGNLRGPLVGAIFLVALPEVLRYVPGASSDVDNWRVVIFGAALILTMHFRPAGVVGAYTLD